MTSFLFLMKNIYEYIHYIQSLKSIWTKIMSTWGCYFCCVFLFLNLFSFLFHYRHVKGVYYFFLKKILNVFQKKKIYKKPVLIPDFFFFFFPQKISKKMETKYKRTSKSLARSFFFLIYTVEKKKKTGDGYSWTHCLYNPGPTTSDYELKERTFYSILELWLFTNHMDICGCIFLFCFFLFFVPT